MEKKDNFSGYSSREGAIEKLQQYYPNLKYSEISSGLSLLEKLMHEKMLMAFVFPTSGEEFKKTFG